MDSRVVRRRDDYFAPRMNIGDVMAATFVVPLSCARAASDSVTLTEAKSRDGIRSRTTVCFA
jgi:hypothetical protein